MARPCSICARPDAGQIAVLLREGRSARSVALEVGVSEDALQRHARAHVLTIQPAPAPTTVRKPAARAPKAPARSPGRPKDIEPPDEDADPLDELVNALRDQALAGHPAIVHQYRLALAAQQDARHAAPTQRDLASEPEWLALRGRLLDALDPYPDARLAVVTAIEAIAG